ncbi:MAG: hypothetical protein QM665_05330 [Desulfovibrio sp.]
MTAATVAARAWRFRPSWFFELRRREKIRGTPRCQNNHGKDGQQKLEMPQDVFVIGQHKERLRVTDIKNLDSIFYSIKETRLANWILYIMRLCFYAAGAYGTLGE